MIKLKVKIVFILELITFSFSLISKSNLRLTDTTYSLSFDSTNWSYDSSNGVYYQIGVIYCTNPATTDYNSLGIYVPANYLTCTAGSSNKYSCSINSSGTVGSYTATTAPIVFPINTAGYSAQKGPTSYSYSGLDSYLKAGLIYVYAGCRGRNEGETYNSGAPWGVTDLKASIRYIRYNSDSIPGDKDSIFSFGHSGGGAQSCLLGITGDSSLYTNYLNKIGAAMTDSSGNSISDSIKGSQCWCPITNLDTADMAYEWNMGQYVSTGTRADGTFTKSLSDDLTNQYISYINNIKLKDESGTTLLLSTSESNTGTYYDYLKSVIETSLNNFLSDTEFPYTPSSNEQGDGGFGGGGDSGGSGGSPPSGGDPPSGDPPSRRLSTTYNSVSEYISSLNSDGNWVTYDSSTNTATINSVGDFVTHCKSPTKDVGAFDSLDKSQAENKLFGINSTYNTAHFDTYMSSLLTNNSGTYSSGTNWVSSYPTAYSTDLSETDSLGKTVIERANMYNPMYYIHNNYDGYQSSKVASYFRINTGITQGDTSTCVEMNLALALKNYGKNVEFTTVWDQGHTTAERKGSSYSTSNFISWVADCMGVSSDSDSDSNINYESDNSSNFLKRSLITLIFFICLFC